MKKKNWTPYFTWLAAAVLAVVLAFAAPQREQGVGKVPAVAARSLDQRAVQVPEQLPAGRTLAVLTFKRDQRAEAQSWIEGLQLRQQSGITWLKMPVFQDNGDAAGRTAVEQRLRDRHGAGVDSARVLPLFTDRAAFVRAAGLSGLEHASVLVLDRNGNVLARAEGPYDARKAEALRETLLAQND